MAVRSNPSKLTQDRSITTSSQKHEISPPEEAISTITIMYYASSTILFPVCSICSIRLGLWHLQHHQTQFTQITETEKAPCMLQQRIHDSVTQKWTQRTFHSQRFSCYCKFKTVYRLGFFSLGVAAFPIL